MLYIVVEVLINQPRSNDGKPKTAQSNKTNIVRINPHQIRRVAVQPSHRKSLALYLFRIRPCLHSFPPSSLCLGGVIMSQTKFNFLDQDECDQVQSNIVRNQHQTTQRIAKAWHIFATTNKLKHNTQKRRDAQFTFISGAVATLPEVPMLISLCLASGRDLESVIER